MKFIIYSKYFRLKLLEIIEKKAEQVSFKKGAFMFSNKSSADVVFVSIEKIDTCDDFSLRARHSALVKMSRFLNLISEQPIVVTVDDDGIYVNFTMTQMVARF